MNPFQPEIGNTENSKNNFQILYDEHGTPHRVEFIDRGENDGGHITKMFWNTEATNDGADGDAGTGEVEAEARVPFCGEFDFTGFGWKYKGYGALALIEVLTTLGFEDTIKARVFEEQLSGLTFTVDNDGQWTESV